MNSKILLGIFVFMGIICNAIYAGNAQPFGAAVKRVNPWVNPEPFNLSETLKLTAENKKEIQGVEREIADITRNLQEIQEALGENFQGRGSTTPLKAAGLGDLQKLYLKLIENYKNIIGYFGSTDHYYLPLPAKEYEELRGLIESFAKKAGIIIKAEDISAQSAARGG